MKGDAFRILKNTFWMLFDRVFRLFTGLYVTLHIANHYGKAAYGSYQYAISVVAVLEILVTFVDGRVVKKRYPTCDAHHLVFNATLCRGLFSAASAVIGGVYLFVTGKDVRFSAMFTLQLINAIATNLRFGMVNRFEYMLRSRKTVVAADIAAFISMALQVIAVRLDLSIVIISLMTMISSFVNLGIVFIQYRLEFRGERKAKVDPELISDMIRESLPLAIAASCATIYTRSDAIMLGSMISANEVGIYAIAVKLLSVIQMAIDPIAESVYPKLISLYSQDRKAYQRRYIQISSMMTWLYVLGVLFSFLIFPVLIRLLKPEYAEALPLYRILVLGIFFLYNAGLRAGHYTLIGRGQVLMYAQIFSMLCNIVMNAIGISLFGMYGAALATVLTQFASLMLSNLFFGREGRQVFLWQVRALNPLRMLPPKPTTSEREESA